MSTREYVNHILDGLSEEQLQGLAMLLNGFSNSSDIPNNETLTVMNDVNNNKNLSREFHSVAELMLTIRYHNSFKKDYKKILKRHLNIHDMETVIDMLANEQPLPEKYKDHALTGDWKGFRECHIQPDWLLIYKIQNDSLILTLSRTGSHSDLF